MLERNSVMQKCDDLRACAYYNWFEDFSKITIKSVIIPIPTEIVEYLKDEIIILPKECYDNETAETQDQHEDDDALDTPVRHFQYANKRLFYISYLSFAVRFSATRISRF